MSNYKLRSRDVPTHASNSVDSDGTPPTRSPSPEPNVIDAIERLSRHVTLLEEAQTRAQRKRTPSKPSSASTSDNSSTGTPQNDPSSRRKSRDDEHIHVRVPEFHGKISEYAIFWDKCLLYFECNPRKYSDPEARVRFVISRFEGSAFNTVRPIVRDSNHPLRQDFKAFREKLDKIYQD